MDAYEATGIVFSRIHALDPENASKIMGLLLLQDHGDKEMIRLAFGPEALFHSVVVKARKELGLAAPFSNPSTPASLATPPVFSRSRSASLGAGEEMFGPGVSPPAPAPMLAEGDGDSSPTAAVFPLSNGHHHHHHHRRSCSAAELCLDSEPCLYYARGFCKNGTNCRFIHGLPEESEPAAAAIVSGGGGGGDGGKMDERLAVEQQYHDLLLRSRSQTRMGSPSFPVSPPLPISSKSMSFLLHQQQQQQLDSQRAAASLMMSGDEEYEFVRRSRLHRNMTNADLMNSGSRQIYLTFPADSTFREEDVSNYFSMYGPVQDVRIPYQQKRMFGFVTFVYPETVQLILDKGNPHFVCDCRVLVKPYKEKGKVQDKKQHQFDRFADYYGLSSPTAVNYRESYELQKLVDARARMLYGNSQELMLRRKLEEQQQAAALQQAIELEQRRFMGLHLSDLKTRNPSSPVPSLQLPNLISPSPSITITTPTSIATGSTDMVTSAEAKCPNPGATMGTAQAGVASVTAAATAAMTQYHNSNAAVNTVASATGSGKEESMTNGGLSSEVSDFFPESVEHNLPDSPFATMMNDSFSSIDAIKPSSDQVIAK